MLLTWYLLPQGLHMAAGQTPCQSFWKKLLSLIQVVLMKTMSRPRYAAFAPAQLAHVYYRCSHDSICIVEPVILMHLLQQTALRHCRPAVMVRFELTTSAGGKAEAAGSHQPHHAAQGRFQGL